MCYTFCLNVQMRSDSTIRDLQAARLRQARASAGFKNPAAAIEKFGWKASTYMAHENGQNGIRPDPALEYAKAYNVEPGWLLTGIGRGPLEALSTMAPKPEHANEMHVSSSDQATSHEEVTNETINVQRLKRDVPILGAAACGSDGMFELNGQTIDYARRWPRLVGVKDLYALYTIGGSMSPWREHGELVYVGPHQPVKIGDHVVVQLIEEPGHAPAAFIKRLDRRTERELRLFQYSPAESLTIAMKRVKSIHRVIPWSELST